MNDTPETHPEIETELDADIAAAEAEGDHGADDDGLAPLDAVIAERDQWKDRALRAIAEAENVKRRAESQSNDARAYAIQRFSRDLLGVADSLQRALQAAPRDVEAAAGLVTGLEMVEKALLTAFDNNGLKRVEPQAGDAFDPHLHQAMMEQPSDTVPGGRVIQTLQPGYALFDRTVRAAMVVVAAKGSGQAAEAYAETPAPGGTYDTKA